MCQQYPEPFQPFVLLYSAQAWTAGIDFTCVRDCSSWGGKERKGGQTGNEDRSGMEKGHRVQPKQGSLSPGWSRLELDLCAAMWLSPMATVWLSGDADWVNSACKTRMCLLIKT